MPGRDWCFRVRDILESIEVIEDRMGPLPSGKPSLVKSQLRAKPSATTSAWVANAKATQTAPAGIARKTGGTGMWRSRSRCISRSPSGVRTQSPGAS